VTTDETIRSAIRERRLLQFGYKDATRIVEPHDYGRLGGRLRLFVYQVGGRSRSPLPGLRMIDVEGIRNVVRLDGSFPGSRARPDQAHKHWDEIFARVE